MQHPNSHLLVPLILPYPEGAKLKRCSNHKSIETHDTMSLHKSFEVQTSINHSNTVSTTDSYLHIKAPPQESDPSRAIDRWLQQLKAPRNVLVIAHLDRRGEWDSGGRRTRHLFH